MALYLWNEEKRETHWLLELIEINLNSFIIICMENETWTKW